VDRAYRFPAEPRQIAHLKQALFSVLTSPVRPPDRRGLANEIDLTSRILRDGYRCRIRQRQAMRLVF
jgi:hypothetical protein